MQQNDQQLNTTVEVTLEEATQTEQSNTVDDQLSTVDVLEGDVADNGSDETCGEQAARQSNAKGKLGRFWDIALWVLIAVLAVAVVLRAFVFTNITIDGYSMTATYYNDASLPSYNPDLTYHHEQIVRVVKVAKPERGDVVVFYKYPIDSKFKALFARGDDVRSGGKYEKLIKRVVALEGDRLWIEKIAEGQYRLVVLTSNNEILYENYYEKDGQALAADVFVLRESDKSGLGVLANCTLDNPFVVSEGHFFAMGDNRADSHDSRVLDEIPMEQLYGVVLD